MKTEIEIFEVVKKNSTVYNAIYAIYDGDNIANITQNIKLTTLLEHVIDNEMNWLYITAPDVLSEVDALSYLEDNLTDVVLDYLTTNLQEAA